MPLGAQALHPIKLQASLHETIWGGDLLARVAGKSVPPSARVGESWETEVSNVALNAPYAGATLGDLTERLGASLLGTRAVEVFGNRFPLLTKFIDAHDKLSVQVHPDDAYAREHESGKLGKTEAWYILHADPGSYLVYGLARTSTREDVRHAIDQTRLEDLLRYAPVQPGDVVFVPAGTIHAIGAGIVLYELQEYSDVTYRLYDYGRLQADGTPRPLHIQASLDVMRYDPPAAMTVRPADLPGDGGLARRRALVGCPYFVLEEWSVAGQAVARTQPTSCEILSVLDDTVDVAAPDQQLITLTVGETAVLPALLGAYSLTATSARLLRSYVPAADDAVLRQWAAAQVPSRQS